MRDIHEHAEGLSDRKRQLFELLVREKAKAKRHERAGGCKVPPIEPRRASDPLVLSFGQERLWFLQQLEPERAAYRIPAAVQLTGALRFEVLAAAIGEVVRRHETLRTTFKSRDGVAVLEIAPRLDVALPRIDLRQLPPAGREPIAREIVAERAAQPFDLVRGPLFRVDLIQLEERRHVLLLVLHHTISDTWSVGVFIRETAALYAAYGLGNPSPLPPLTVQYADFARWQREYVRGSVLDEQLAYWRRRFAGAATVLELPTDRPRPPVQTFRGARQYLLLGAPLTAGLQALGQRCEASLFMAALASLSTLLFRYSRQEDISVGTPFSNRNRSEVEGLIGFFVNTLVLRSDFAARPTFIELLAQVREVTLEAYANSDVPFERIVEALQLPRDLSRNPIWQVDFAFQNAPMPRLEAVGLALSRFEIAEGASRFDLELDLRDTPDGLGGWIGYNRDLFEPATAARMVAHFCTLIEAIVAEPARSVEELRLLTAAEREEMLAVAGGAPDEATIAELCLHGLFAERARSRPDAIALSTASEQFSYGEIERRANRLARRLVRRGVAPEVRVGICCERSPALVVTILGTLKAGGTYVPLDPAYPNERLSYLLADARATIVLTQGELRERLSDFAGEVLALEEVEREAAETADGVPPAVAVQPENLAYIIYTSGSTGRPKGVAVEHRQAVRLFSATAGWFGFSAADVWTLFHSFAFDFSVWEIWGAFLHGGRLVVVPYWLSRSPESFSELLQEQAVTVLNQTPSAFQQLMRVAVDTGCLRDSALRWIVFGGEALDIPSLEPWFAMYGDDRPRLVNMYGITETTVHVTHRPLSRADLTSAPRSVIGRPLPDLEVLLLDGGLELVGTGLPGEIHVGGAGLARGYFGRPDLTAERFVPHRFSRRPGDRLYRSGDLARRTEHRELHYLGRGDQQVKVRGFRIELREIEAALSRHPALGDLAVVPQPDNGGQRLVAYFVSARKPAPGADELRKFLQERLPEHMVPSAFLELDALPLTVHGKLDRRALPLPGPARPALSNDYCAPRSAEEEAIVSVWCDILGLERVGVHDSFFELGGQSLLATQVTSRIRDLFQVDLSLRTLFQHPTIAGLAEAVRGARSEGRPTPAGPIVPLPRHRELPLSFAQERLWFIHQLHPWLSAYNIPGAVRLAGPLDRTALTAALREIGRRHEVLRSTFATVDGRPVQVIHPELALDIPLAYLSGLAAHDRRDEASRIANAEARRPFDLARGPLIRALLLRESEEHHLLVLNIHHIVYDMWSRQVFIRELGVLYESFVDRRPSPLTELPLQYADFAAWQRQWLSGEVLDEHLAYWKEQLAGIPAALELATDRPRPATPSFRGARAFVALSPQLTEDLKALSQRQGTTLFILLLAGFTTLLYRSSGQDDVLVGSPIANRNRGEIEGLIGFFANTLVMRSRFPCGATFQELLAATRETAFGAYAHQDLAFERLVGELRQTRDQNRHPLVQVLFNFIQNYRPPDMVLGRLTLSPEWVHNGASAFDFTLSLWEVGGRLQGAMDYSVDLFDRTTATRLLDRLGALLASAMAAPQRPVADLGWLGGPELHQMLWEWNDTRASYPHHGCLHRLIEEQVERTPEATAVVGEGSTLTYGELDRRANRLANLLVAHGVCTGDRVGVSMERSIELVVTLLGILKAGAAYVPLEPSYPDQRLLSMLADACPAAILAPDGQRTRLAGSSQPSLHWVTDRDLVALDSASAERPAVAVDPRYPAYVIYTSGSTGQPKGAVVHHAAITNRLAWMQEQYRLEPEDRVLQKTPFSFDVSVWEFFWPLLAGAAVVVARPGGHQDPSYLSRWIVDAQVTTVHFVPSMLRLFLEAADLGVAGVLRRVLCSGEALPPDVERRCFERLATPLYNLYGPTEAAVDVTAWACKPAGSGRSVPIGRPIGNLRTYVLDAEMRPAPIGVGGELYLGGVGLGLGYLQRPELTAEAFVPCPHGDEAGGRLYRTGDLARLLADGNLEFLGRTDHQVKVRGFRVELAEVEATIAELLGGGESAVVARADSAGTSYLAAYITLGAERSDGLDLLRQALTRRLPEFMVPSAFFAIDALPLSSNGKVDRRALARLDGTPLATGAPFVPPRSDLERELVWIWSTLLGIESQRIGVRDNFFRLGGHSLLTTQLLSRLRTAFGVEIELSAFFEAPTVAGLSEAIEVSRWADDASRQLLGAKQDDFEEWQL